MQAVLVERAGLYSGKVEGGTHLTAPAQLFNPARGTNTVSARNMPVTAQAQGPTH